MANRRQVLGVLLNREVKRLLRVLQELESAGKEVLVNGISKELTDAKKQQLIAEVKQSAVVADSKVKAWLVPAVSGVYVDSLNDIDDRIARFGFNTGLGRINVEVLRSAPIMKPHLQAVNALMSDAYLDFGSGITGWVKGNEHILNDTIRRQMQSKIAVGRLTGEAVRDIKKEIIQLLETRGFEALIDRSGRQWTLDRYGEMLTRTHLIKANTEASVNRMRQFEIDITEVSSHGTDDPLCLLYEGNIYSLSGQSEAYKKLPVFPPFHPNCKHTLYPRPDLDKNN